MFSLTQNAEQLNLSKHDILHVFKNTYRLMNYSFATKMIIEGMLTFPFCYLLSNITINAIQ